MVTSENVYFVTIIFLCFYLRYRRLSVALRDNVLIDWLANAIISITVSIVRDDIINTVEKTVFSTVTEYLDRFNAFIAPASFS